MFLNLDFQSRAKCPRGCVNSVSWCAKALKFLAQNEIKMIEKLIQKSKNITAAGRSDIEPAWIAQAQRRLGFALPVSYKRMLLRYANVSAAGTELKTIAPPEFAGSADADICYTYKINLKNDLFAADELVFLQLEDEEYYFKISPASGIADGSPNTAHGKTAGVRAAKLRARRCAIRSSRRYPTVRKIEHRTAKRARQQVRRQVERRKR